MPNVLYTPDGEQIEDTVQTGDVHVSDMPAEPFLIGAPDDAPLNEYGEWTGEEYTGWEVEAGNLFEAVGALTDAGYSVSVDERAVKIAEEARD